MDKEIKEEKVNFSNSNLMKLDVSKGENITELYIQGNRLTEIDLSANKNIRILDCTDNPLRFIKAAAPLGGGALTVEACKGGTVGLKYGPSEGQKYFAYEDKDYKFEGWYDILGDRVSKEKVMEDAYGMSRELFAMFVKNV